MAEVRETLGLSRDVMGRLIGLSAREVYYVEMGRIPATPVVDRLKLIQLISPIVLVLSVAFDDVMTWWSFRKKEISLLLKGRIEDTGQYRLPI